MPEWLIDSDHSRLITTFRMIYAACLFKCIFWIRNKFDVTRELKPKYIIDQLRREFGATFGYSTILKAKEAILLDSLAEQTLQFAQLPEYFRRIASQDESATIDIQLVSGTFSRCFVAPSAARNAYRFCRKFVALDRTGRHVGSFLFNCH